MPPPATTDTPDPQRAEIADALRAQRLQTHRANLPWAVGGALLVALFFVALQWGTIPTVPLMAWLAAVACVLLLRGATGIAQGRDKAGPASHPRWLRRYRLGFLAHGLVWGLACALPWPAGDTHALVVLIVVLTGLTGSSFALTAFDLVAALAFGVPVLGILAGVLLAQPQAQYHALSVAAVASLFFLSMTARRASQLVGQYVALRVAEAHQADALRRNEDLLARTGAIAGVGGWVLDRQHGRLQLTEQACRIHGLAPGQQPTLAQCLGHYPDHQQALQAAFEQAASNGQAFDLTLPLRLADAPVRWVRLIGQPQQDSHGHWQVAGVVQDITQARSAELALAEKHYLLDLLVRTTHQGFWFIDAQGLTTDANPAMCQILGRPREALLGQSIYAFVDDANRQVFERELAQRDRGMAGGYEIALQRPDGSNVHCFNHATPIFDAAGRRTGSIGMWTDISQRKQAEQDLRHTSEQLRQKTEALQLTLDSISQGLAHISATGRVLVHNRRVIELLDLPPALLDGEPLFDDVVRFQAQRGDLKATAGFVDVQGTALPLPFALNQSPTVYVRRNRAGQLLEVRTRHLPDGGVVRTFADVTDYLQAQQALREREAEWRAVLDAFPGYIAVIDSQFRYLYVNDRLATLFGAPAAQIVGRRAQDVLSPARFELVRAAVARCRDGQPSHHQSEYQAQANGPRTILQVTHALGEAEADGQRRVYAFAIDVTARINAEEALTAAKNQAERADQAKTRFLSAMSHELRTPMNAILGFGQLLASDTRPALAAHQQAQVQQILRGAHHLLDLINDVLDLAVVEAGRMHLQLAPVPLGPQLQDALALVQTLAQERRIHLSVAEGLAAGTAVLADRTRLKQVLLNLLSNAIKYNRVGGFVQIRCQAEAETGSLCIEVADSGPGLDAAQCARLFDAFERLDADRSAVQGAGLGLALSRSLMQAMHGEIGVRSLPGVGSTFWLRLPWVPPLTPATPATPASIAAPAPLADDAVPAPAASRGTVLYIEDNPVNVLLMEAVLGRLDGVRLIVATTPAQGLQRAHDEQPDLVLLDIQLPDMDGYAVLQRLRADPASQHIPVIAVSANAMATDVQRGLAAGFADYLAKPLDLHALLAAVDSALQRRAG